MATRSGVLGEGGEGRGGADIEEKGKVESSPVRKRIYFAKRK